MICNGLIFGSGHGIIQMNFIVNMEFAVYNKKVGGEISMCKMLEDMRNEASKQTTKDNARRLLKLGKIKVEEIAECFPDLSDSDIKEIETEVMQLA